MIIDILLARLAMIPQVDVPQPQGDFAAHLPQEVMIEPEAPIEVSPNEPEPEPEVEGEAPPDLAKMPIEVLMPMLAPVPVPVPVSMAMGIALRMAETPIVEEVEPAPLAEVIEPELTLPLQNLPENIEPEPEPEPELKAPAPSLSLQHIEVTPNLPLKTPIEPEQAELPAKLAAPKAIEKVQIPEVFEPSPLQFESRPQPEAPAQEAPHIVEFEPLVNKREAPLPVKAPLVRNVMERMETLQIEPGKTKILLRPDGLGTLEIDLSQAADGQMQLVIRVENPIVLDALRQESAHLAGFMGAKGFDLAGGEPQLDHYEPEKRPAKDENDDLIVDEEVQIDQQLGADSLNIMT